MSTSKFQARTGRISSHGRAVSLAVSSGYAVFGFLWVLLAEWLLDQFVDDPEMLAQLLAEDRRIFEYWTPAAGDP